MAALTGCSRSTAQGEAQAAATATPTIRAVAPTPAPTLAPTAAPPAGEGQPAAEAAPPAWSPEVGAALSDFELTGVDGQTYSLSDFEGKAMVLNFWATWCPHCRSELPTFKQVYAEREQDGFVLAAVSVNEAPDTVKSVVAEEGLDFPVLLDSTGAVASTYLVRGIPASYFVDRNGIIRGSHVGAITDAEALNKVVDALLK